MSIYYDKGIHCRAVIIMNVNVRESDNTVYFPESQIFLNPVFTDGGDMDARDYVRMRYEKRLREGLEDGLGHNQTIGSFEKFTKVRKLSQHISCCYLLFFYV